MFFNILKLLDINVRLSNLYWETLLRYFHIILLVIIRGRVLPKKYKSKLSRTIAYKKLREILSRINTWNELHSKYYEIEQAALVGSLARDGEKFGDIDICMKIRRSRQFSPTECKKEYIKWREEVLGYAPPRDFFVELGTFELDVSRFVKNRDGRIDILRWDQFDPICLTLNPYIKLIENRICVISSVDEIEKSRTIFTESQALDIVKGGIPENPLDKKGEYWDSYCCSLKLYPEFIRKAVLERDNNQEAYERYMKA